MSTVNLKDDVTFHVESCDFSIEYNGKTFTSTTFNGALKQKEEHQKMLEEREMDRNDLVEVVNLRGGEEYLYNPEKQHLYKENTHGKLDRCEYELYSNLKKIYIRKIDLDAADELLKEKRELEQEFRITQQKINNNISEFDSLCVKLKSHKKKRS